MSEGAACAYNLSSLFPEVDVDSTIQKIFSDLKVVSVKVYKNEKKIEALLESESFVDKSCLDSAANKVKKAYFLDSFKINVKYKNIPQTENYLEEYFNNIKYCLNKEYAICRSLLADSLCKHKNEKLTIELKYGGKDILEDNKCDKHIQSILREDFGEDIKVEFINAHELSGKKHEYFEFKENEEGTIISKILEEAESTSPRYNAEGNTSSRGNSNGYGNGANNGSGGGVSKDGGKKNFNSGNSYGRNSGGSNGSDNVPANVLLGKVIKGDSIPLSEVNQESGKVIIEGEIFSVDIREIKGDRYIVSFDITDYATSLTAKFFSDKDKIEGVSSTIKSGICVKLRGEAQYDKYARELVVFVNDIAKLTKEEKEDRAEKKRVELHLHTQMSSMDGVSSVKDLVGRAAKWGHPAIAITDHGVVQAFPDAYEAGKKNNIKIIYGVECYLVNNGAPIVYNNGKGSLDGDFVIFDIETTGLNARNDKITEIGAVKISNGEIVGRFSTFVNPGIHIPEKITEITGINDNTVKDAPKVDTVIREFLDFSKGSVLVAHNATFDTGFIKVNAENEGLTFDYGILDTLELTRVLFKQLKRHKLDVVAKYLNIPLNNHHRAVYDAEATAGIFLKCVEVLKKRNIEDISQINNAFSGAVDIKKTKSHHAIILVKDYTGLKNLYKIISMSHLDHFYKKPRLPKSLLMQYREGLIIGSACEAGEVYKTVLQGTAAEDVGRIVGFYDYLEIQPLGNNKFLIENGTVKNEEQLKQINIDIVKLGAKYRKPVVATCDVHFLDPRDEIYRRVLMASQGFKDADKQAPLYLRTTDEMLKEFYYLGKDKAYEVVVENTNKIADMIEDIIPIPEETFTPEIPGAEEEIQTLSIKKSVAIYGDPLPDIVKERMDKELNSIIKNGFSVMYIIAQKLVTKSLSDGYLVGSRGSVGSSFVAFLTDITEVNALPPHYICPKCKYSEFITDGSVGSGVDMPDKACPQCGTSLKKDGHDIPFETFLGFDGDKEPDIDLNFSGEYQANAHKYTEELFGKGHVFRAGTIGTIAEKTAFGFVKKYLDEKQMVVHNAEINRLVKGCTGVKRTTGQHPGGVMIVPKKNEIFEFCPIQRPADDNDSEIITTHFDYHSISGRLLKLDILGHDDPTVIKMLEDLTGVNAREIPLDDPKTMSIFTTTEALSIKPEDIDSQVGSFAIPEFGTKFVRQMLIDTKPKTFAELVRISGLSHGTDVWLNNAQDLVRSGTAPLSEVICTRDDIMVYLMHKGVPSKQAFKIMESVRKGKGLKEEDEQIMKENNVPNWYIDSCKKIKYMFPKAHAVAYVTMAYRIAWFKVHHPKAFYIAYFSVRADDFDAVIMANGADKVKRKIKELEALGNNITTKDKNVLTILEVCSEMYSRGIDFMPIDLYKSHPVKFMDVPGGILPPLNTLQGLGTTAAESIARVREDGVFISVDDLRIRAKVSKTVLEILKDSGCLDGLPESNQLSLF